MMDEIKNKTVLRNVSIVRLIHGCKVTSFKNYLKEFPWCVDYKALPTISRICKGFVNGSDVDFMSYFDLLINRLVIGKSEYVPRKAAIILVDQMLLNCDLFNKNSTFKRFELEQREKIGPYSIRLPFKDVVKTGPCEYFNTVPSTSLTFDRVLLNTAIFNVSKILQPDSLNSVSLDNVYLKSDKTTQWGAPYFRKGNDDCDGVSYASKYLDIAINDLKTRNITWYPNIMFMRTQPSGKIIPKQRITFGAPHSITLLESTLQTPLLNALKNLPQFSENLSLSAFNSYATNLFRICNGSGINIIGFDASSYDKSLCSDLLYGAYGLLKVWFSADDHWLIDQVCDYMIHSDLITPDGVFRGRSKGVASGLSFTNMIDSLIQYILFEYTRLKLDAPIDTPLPSFQGDDGVWAIRGLDNKILSSIMSEFSITVNPDKVSCSLTYFTFCQRLYMYDYKVGGLNVGIRSAYRTINSIISYERRRKDGWTGCHDSVRVIMQCVGLEANPIHSQFVLSLSQADKLYGLGIKHPNGIRGLFKAAGDIENVIQMAGGSSWDRDKLRAISHKLLSLKTIRVLMSILSDRGANV